MQVQEQALEIETLRLEQQIRDLDDKNKNNNTSMNNNSSPQTSEQLQQLATELNVELQTLRREKYEHSQKHLQDMTTLKNQVNGIAAKGMERLPEDSFTLLAVASTCSLPWSFSLFILVMQLICFTLVILDILASGDTGNVLGVPGNVSPQLRGIQVIALLIAVGTEQDLVKGVRMLRPGLYPALEPYFPHLRPWKFWLALLSLMTEGCMALLTSFFLILTQTTVIDLLLNFTALGFVSHLDELVFFLAKMSILGRRCKDAVWTVVRTTFPSGSDGSGSTTNQKCYSKTFVKNLILGSIIIVMFSGWLVISLRQSTGYYLCDTIIAQFGDDYLPAMGTFSGMYRMRPSNNALSTDRHVDYYMELPASGTNGADDNALFAKFSYCKDMEAWTFTINADDDACLDWWAKSSPGEAFDIFETLDAPWYVRGKDQRLVVLEPLSLTCYDCRDEDGCHGHGTCVAVSDGSSDHVCQCEEPWFGLRCDFVAPCESVSINAKTEPFVGNMAFATEFQILRKENGDMFQVYYRPVYVHKEEDEYWTDVIFFTGRRWALTSVTGNVTEMKLPNFFQMNVSVDFLSEPTDFETLTGKC